ncbi:myotubularin-related protein 13 [Uranotaenia lowii]|uniref:myotubularin-related protein 13 n=1 Tax=Uranotaenia lowii TaxID=190385 RepID=UPI0024788698|nr:myotubularin-related protein 13 [Uranotaenia lowii]XP_055601638.1 myotubularin-related protein 13 [Uranotaenia lowii]XP_055601639.1 myotubularin-related protein 13 [Uranotaenia lowii]
MSRLADYFVIVGYDHEKERTGLRSVTGKILQRFPEKDWPDSPLQAIEMFCQPQGWSLSTVRQEPQFFVSVLTDIDANRHYCACLCFNEAIAITPSKPIDEEEEDDNLSSTSRALLAAANSGPPSITHHSIMYAPKCLVIVSRMEYIETFRNCLGTIYTVYLESLKYPLHHLIGSILGCIQVPPPGGPQVRFSIGAGDKQVLQPPLSHTLPVTGSCVSLLFHQLGIKNVMLLFCAVMTEHKILFHSTSYSRLTDSCRALTALMYPFRYSHVYIPLLPAPLVEVLSTPTPFIMGIHSALLTEVTEVLDVIIADLDGGSIHIPESLVPPVSKLPRSLWESTECALRLVLHPELALADLAFPSNNNVFGFREKRNDEMLDKEIRAVFMRLFAQLLQGYRSYLTLIRINPKPIIQFHRAGFLGARDLVDCDFLSRVLDSMFFTGFVTERGPPWRPCDAWDELYSAMNDLLKQEAQNPNLVLTHIQDLAKQLFTNENPSPQPYQQKILRPPEGAYARIHQPPMPLIDVQEVQKVINDGIAANDLPTRLQTLRPTFRIVPMGPYLKPAPELRPVVYNSARKLEVLKNCINCIFDNKITEARKSFPAVLRILQQRDARLTLCRELAKIAQGNKQLDHQQFDLVVKLMNRALQDDSSKDEFGVAAALLPLSTTFCRKLCTGVIQFAYTCIQDHPVWRNQQFWEDAFYHDVQNFIKELYLPRHSAEKPYSSWSTENNGLSHSLSRDKMGPALVSRAQEPTALEIAADQIRKWPTTDVEKQQELSSSEEKTLYSQAIHYANRMVFLLIPQDVNNSGKVQKYDSHNDDDASVSNSVIESHSHSDHSDEGFEENDPGEIGSSVAKMVCKFIDRVCNEGNVTTEHLRNLHQMVPVVIQMHIEMLEAVNREAKRIPPIQKPKLQYPSLLTGEGMIGEPMRVYLLPDGREDKDVGMSNLLPAEGALFLTNYRIVFKGWPCDPYCCEQSIVRAFPISSLTKEKRLTVIYLQHLEQVLQEGMQLRSCTFQLIKVAFDEEVMQESIETFRKNINRFRHPEDEFGHFAFATTHGISNPTPLKVKEKNATLKDFAKKTLLRTAKKAGFKQKGATKRKYILPGADFEETYGTGGGINENPEDEDGSDEGTDTIPRVIIKDVERLKERSYVKDWFRVGLGDVQTGYRISSINCNYSLCRTYPAMLVCPKDVSDDALRNLSRCYKHHRIPVATWRHKNGATLLRGAVPLAKGVMSMLKGHPGATNTSADSASFQEQDRYFVSVIKTTPHTRTIRHTWGLSDSNISLDSLALTANSLMNRTENSTLTPDAGRRNNVGLYSMNNSSFSSFGALRSNPKQNKWGSLKPGGHTSATTLRDVNNWDQSQQYSFQRVPLYFLGEKSQSKSAKLSEMYAEFIPVDYTDVRHSRTAFKKLMRACLPSCVNTEPDQTFSKLVEQSEWLQQIRGLLQLSGAVVDLMDLQESSVTLALEDGWDVTAQISSLAQLCLDPHYRTIEGFRVLIEKEWLAFGHRFGHRSNLKPNSNSGSPFAPTFLQFLDAVHQIQSQFPLAFEFNEFYLRFLAYHHVSCRFRTFLFDCELERVDFGITAIDDKRGSLNSHHKQVVETLTVSDDDNIYPGGVGGGGVGRGNHASNTQKFGPSLFDYIERQHAKNPIFYNFMYTPDPERQVLRPQSSVSVLEIWSYFLDEELAQGPPYDPELVGNDTLDEDSDYVSSSGSLASKHPRRKVVSVGYDSLNIYDADAFSRLLEELKNAEAERGLLPQKWRQVWDKLELPHSDSLTRHASFSSALVRSHGRLLHKRSTLEIIMRGRQAGYHQENFLHPHRFEKHAYSAPINCNHCGNVLWGPLLNGLRCVDCGNTYHEKCAESVPKNCTKYKAVEGNQQTLARNQGDNNSVSSSVNTTNTASHHYYDQFSSNVADDRTHEGYLYKRGAILKNWKQRWFVLDSHKHQLRYYDAMEDSNCKGFIELAEVQSVAQAPPQAAPVPSKKIDERAFFDLKTSRRTYNFYAVDANSAQEWIEKIQACLQ